MKPSLRAVVTAIVLAVPLAISSPAHAANSLTMLGADVSSLQRSLDLGAKYYNKAGSAADPYDILKSAGANYMRLRIWNSRPAATTTRPRSSSRPRRSRPRASSC